MLMDNTDTKENVRRETVQLVVDYMHRSMMHHCMWFSEVQHQYGSEAALALMEKAFKQSYDIHTRRFAKIFGFEMTDGLPAPLLAMSGEQLAALKESLALNWLATDGVWFQAVENTFGMTDAKRINDSCWAQFSPFEAWSVKKLLGLPDNPGLEGLKKALQYRLYATINKQEIVEETDHSFVFRMVDCRVQSARKKKGLEDYPCKSAGIVEYRAFAENIDKRIKTQCLSCPPDAHPEGWYCSWKFELFG